MLNGVGGRTIAEAKENMTLEEARRWSEYVDRHGSLNIARHIERGFALIAHLLSVGHKIKINGKIPGMEDFMPHRIEQPISLDQAMREWV